jgi:hypothetical protein
LATLAQGVRHFHIDDFEERILQVSQFFEEGLGDSSPSRIGHQQQDSSLELRHL